MTVDTESMYDRGKTDYAAGVAFEGTPYPHRSQDIEHSWWVAGWAEAATAELAALKGRRCDGCADYGDDERCMKGIMQETEWVEPDFYCKFWEAKQ